MIGTELAALTRMCTSQPMARITNALAPESNAAIHATTGVEPIVWTGGLYSQAKHYLPMQQRYQQMGVPLYLVDTGVGTRPIARNASEIRSVMDQAMQETGADKVWLAGHSKGTIDIREVMQSSPHADSVRGAFMVVGPHDGGFVADPRVGSAVRTLYDRLPGFAQDALQAQTELATGSAPLTRLNDDFQGFLARMPDDFRIHNFTSDVTSKLNPIQHDLLVPLDSQRLPANAKVVEHQIEGGARNHLTAHMNDEVVDRVFAAVHGVA